MEITQALVREVADKLEINSAANFDTFLRVHYPHQFTTHQRIFLEGLVHEELAMRLQRRYQTQAHRG